MSEAGQFAKDIRAYLCEIERQRPLTQTEQNLWDQTHPVHQHANDVYLMVQEQTATKKEIDGHEKSEHSENSGEIQILKALEALRLLSQIQKEITTPFGMQDLSNGYQINKILYQNGRVCMDVYLLDRKIKEKDEYVRGGDECTFYYLSEEKILLSCEEYEERCREAEVEEEISID